MNLLENPFFLLGASPRDNRRKIIELAEERSLTSETGDYSAARADLTNPKKRLVAEIAWLPGIGPRRAKEVVSLLKNGDHAGIFQIEKIPPMARSNLLAAGLLLLEDAPPSDVAEWILELAQVFEDIETDKLLAVINQDRVVSGFPEISDESQIDTEIQQRRSHFRSVMKSALDKMSSADLVETVTIAVETATDYGEEQGPVLIDDLVDAYEVEAQSFLEKEGANIQAVVERIRTAADQRKPEQAIAVLIKQLIEMIKNWDRVAQPIQVSRKSRGLDHDESHRVGIEVRGLAIDLFNKHNMLDFSKEIIESLGEVFSEVVGFAEKIEEDSSTLTDIVEQRNIAIAEARLAEATLRKEITFETELGIVFKDKLRISPDGIEWKRRNWPLETITRIRWGGTQHYVNGIPTGTTYQVFWGNKLDWATLELKRQDIYGRIIESLWKGVGVRILTDYLEGLREGKKYVFDTAIVDDRGIELQRKKFWSTNERIYCPWRELVISNGPGFFQICKKNDEKVFANLSYQEVDNVHVLEAVIRMFWKRAGERISSLLTSNES